MVDRWIEVTSEEAKAGAESLSREGLFAGQSSGAYLHGVRRAILEAGDGVVVTGAFRSRRTLHVDAALGGGAAPLSAPPRCDVILPVRDAAATLAESLELIRAQTMRDFRCILVDDGSADDSPRIAQHFAQRDARFLLAPSARWNRRGAERRAHARDRSGRRARRRRRSESAPSIRDLAPATRPSSAGDGRRFASSLLYDRRDRLPGSGGRRSRGVRIVAERVPVVAGDRARSFRRVAVAASGGRDANEGGEGTSRLPRGAVPRGLRPLASRLAPGLVFREGAGGTRSSCAIIRAASRAPRIVIAPPRFFIAKSSIWSVRCVSSGRKSSSGARGATASARRASSSGAAWACDISWTSPRRRSDAASRAPKSAAPDALT